MWPSLHQYKIEHLDIVRIGVGCTFDLADQDSLKSVCGLLKDVTERPGFVKTGRTKNPIYKLKSQISRCIIYSPEVINDDDYYRIENHTMVERLIHEEL